MKRSGSATNTPEPDHKDLGAVANKSIRDTQRQKVYDAEMLAFGGSIGRDNPYKTPPDYRTVAECQEFVDKVLASPAWKHLCPFGPDSVIVTDGRGRRRGAAFVSEGEIAMPKFSRRRYYLLHELAHFATQHGEDMAGHGPEYVAAYLHLAAEFLPSEEHAALVSGMASGRVKICDYLGHGVYDGTTVRYVTVDGFVTASDTARNKACLTCGQHLSSNRAKFCSDACRYTYHNRLRHERGEPERKKVCEACGAEFVSSRRDARTCSARCRQRLRRGSSPVRSALQGKARLSVVRAQERVILPGRSSAPVL